MDVDQFLRYILRLEIAILVPMVVLIPVFSGSPGLPPYIYELFGALLAAIITTFGIRNMKNMTE